MLHFSFDNPMQISSGPKPDEMEIEFIDTSLFVSTDFGQTLPKGMKLQFIIPKQFPDASTKETVEQLL